MCSEARRIVVPLQWARDLRVAVCVFTIHSWVIQERWKEMKERKEWRNVSTSRSNGLLTYLSRIQVSLPWFFSLFLWDLACTESMYTRLGLGVCRYVANVCITCVSVCFSWRTVRQGCQFVMSPRSSPPPSLSPLTPHTFTRPSSRAHLSPTPSLWYARLSRCLLRDTWPSPPPTPAAKVGQGGC